MPSQTGSINHPFPNNEGSSDNMNVEARAKSQFSPAYRTFPLLSKLVEVAAAVDHVEKGGVAPADAGGYSYMKAKDIAHAFRKELAQRGILCMGSVIHSERWTDVTKGGKPLQGIDVTMRFTFHDSETSEQLSVDAIGSGLGGDKAAYKAQTGALKYALRSAFLVPDAAADAEEEEPTADAVEYVKAPQRKVAHFPADPDVERYDPVGEGQDDAWAGETANDVVTSPARPTRTVQPPVYRPGAIKPRGGKYGPPKDPDARITDAQRKRLFAISRNAGLSDNDVHEIIAPFGYTSTNEIQKGNYDKICALAESGGIR